MNEIDMHLLYRGNEQAKKKIPIPYIYCSSQLLTLLAGASQQETEPQTLDDTNILTLPDAIGIVSEMAIRSHS